MFIWIQVMHHSLILFWLKDFLHTASEYQSVRMEVNGKCYCNIYIMNTDAGHWKVLLSLSALIKHYIFIRTERESSHKNTRKKTIKNTQKEINIWALDVMLSLAKKEKSIGISIKTSPCVHVHCTLYDPHWTLLFKCCSVLRILNGIRTRNESVCHIIVQY